ncbi:MAG: leucyl aminopeptidase family protein [Beijerinckiaceae bacterium]
MSISIGDPTRGSTPIIVTHRKAWQQTQKRLSPAARAFVAACGFDAGPGAHLVVPEADGGVAAVLFAVAEPGARRDPFLPGKLATLLPTGRYRFEGEMADADLAALGLLLSGYKFGRYRKWRARDIVLEMPRGPERARIEAQSSAVAMGRDLINTPANDLGPSALAAAAAALARKHGARVQTIQGAALAKGFPLVHAVGKGAAEGPRLLDIRWNQRSKGPKVTLVGKGVCFDTGGLDIKPDAAMLLMKKDMGGAATALAAASMIMQEGLDLRLRIILPIVENSVSATAFRPGDVYMSRAGVSVEIGNTDAEGRLILADALSLADEDEPDLLFDFATLTGAARVALGPDLPAMFCGDDALAQEIAGAGEAVNDPVWRLPLWAPYDGLIEGKTADLNNVSGGSFGGAIVAALFLQRFVKKSRAAWAHFDVYNWSQSAKPGRPEGGEIQVARLVFELLRHRVAGGRLAARRKT